MDSVQIRDFLAGEQLDEIGAYRWVTPFGRPSTSVGDEQFRTAFGRCEIVSSILPWFGTARETGLGRFL